LIDKQINQSLYRRANTELERLASVALQNLAIVNTPLTTINVDHIAKKLGHASNARITFIDVQGNVTGDSSISHSGLVDVANHLDRAELVQALQEGVGYARRYSQTLKQELLYAAVFNHIEIKGQSFKYFARASLSSDTISSQVMKVRLALLSLFLFGIISLAVASIFTFRWLATINEKQRAQLANTLLARNREFESIHELDALLSTCSKLEDANNVIEQLLPGLLPRSSGALSIFKSSRDKLTTKIYWGSKEFYQADFTSNQCWALRKGHSHITEHNKNRIYCEHYKSNDALSTLCVPLVSHGDTVGVMHVLKSSFNDETVSLIDTIAKRMSMAIANIELKYSLRQQAIKDALTNLYNRRYLFESLEQLTARALRNKTQIGVILLDLDHFKALNDKYGHDVGDVVLKQVADFFRKATRESDLVCRYGGEEFCIICPDSTHEDTLYVAQKLCTGIASKTINVNLSSTIIVTLSAGIAIYPNPEQSIKVTIKEADLALYQAKDDGRNCVRTR